VLRLRSAVTALLVLLAPAVAGGTAGAHQGNSNFRSVINSIEPAELADGLTAEVVNYDDHVVLENRAGKDVEIIGYYREPYARILADGTVEVNLRSQSHYENEDRYANVELPARVDNKARPEWKQVGGDGRFVWHDHRSHYMSEGVPAQVEDEAVRTKIFDYRIPLRVAGEPAAIKGTLYWNGRDDSIQVLPFILLGLLVLAGGTFLVIRRRRSGPESEAGG